MQVYEARCWCSDPERGLCPVRSRNSNGAVGMEQSEGRGLMGVV